MDKRLDDETRRNQTAFSRRIDDQAKRKLKARRHATRTIWHGLGMMGLIGWSVAIPTVLGIALGIWIDRHYPGRHSWTLMLLLLGLVLGCLNAWHWVAREERRIRQDQEDNDG
ncbi:MAG: F0F1 ATP synthase subunit [Desulfobulbaceae bacterium]|nr:MAG: F0F1 ATP synthase subunit [Desulfobulbaceae bacterium]